MLRRVFGRVCCALGICLAVLLAAASAQAHLMVAQRGTVNVVGTGGFGVMSLPVSDFTGSDEDGDGRLSLPEMRAHGAAIEAQVMAACSCWPTTGRARCRA